MAGWVEGIRRAPVLGLVLIAEIATNQAPSVGPHQKIVIYFLKYICSSDPFPTRLLMSHLHAIVPILQHIVSLCLTTRDFPISCKSSIVIPLIKKPGLDREMLKKL